MLQLLRQYQLIRKQQLEHLIFLFWNIANHFFKKFFSGYLLSQQQTNVMSTKFWPKLQAFC